jgi:lysophospholipid acyltransferase (LPLAT)-like uncharacterized protein
MTDGSQKVLAPQAKARKSSGIVVPKLLKWHQRLAASLVYLFVRVLALTLRYQLEAPPSVTSRATPALYAVWHNRLAIGLIVYQKIKHRQRQPQRLAAMVSASKDGGIFARILEHFGAQPVRGSSSRRGPQALLEMTTWAERGYDLALTPDGPRGPGYVVQAGVISLARVTGRALIPVSHYLGWKVCLKSWDRFQIPLPFSRVVMKFGEPLHVPREATEAELEALRAELEQRLRSMTVD